MLQLVSVVWETCLLDADLVRNITTFYISQARILLNIVKNLQEVGRTTLIILLCGCSGENPSTHVTKTASCGISVVCKNMLKIGAWLNRIHCRLHGIPWSLCETFLG